jgi:type IV pilus assembly protein PilB
MHWLLRAASNAGLQGAESLRLGPETSLAESWEIVARTLAITPAELAARIAPVVRLEPASFEEIDPAAVQLLPERVALKLGVMPLTCDDKQIVVATSDPTNLDVEQLLGFVTARRPRFRLAHPHAIEEAILSAYQSDRAIDGLLESLDNDVSDAVRIVEEIEPEALAQREVDSGPVVKLTNLILRDAVVQGASDVHIEPGPKSGVVRFRIDGVMRRYMQLPLGALSRVVSRIKVLGRMDIANRISPQDGRSRVAIERKTYDLRISTVPTRDAEKCVMRILRPENAKRLDQISMPKHELARLRQLLGCRDGIVVVTGPTGSGKTTTLYSALTEVATEDVNVTTVEDPVEYELPGITQIQVEPKRGVTFASSLRAILRQDPDVIFVGEIRDLETAQIAVQAAMTGHLVLATLHTNDAMSAVPRLLDLGLDAPSIAATLRGVLAQRLVRKLCADCAQPVDEELTEQEERLVDLFGTRPARRAIGCRKCASTGYKGRIPVTELAVITSTIVDMISSGASASALQRAALEGGMRSLRTVAIERAKNGDTSLQEVERVIGERSEEPSLPNVPHMVLVVGGVADLRAEARKLFERSGYSVAEEVTPAAAQARVSAGERFAYVVLAIPRVPELSASTPHGPSTVRTMPGTEAAGGLRLVAPLLTG